VLGYVTSISGVGALAGGAAVQGVQLAVDEVNKAGGILGRQVVLKLADDASDPTTAQTACKSLVDAKVDAIVAFENSAARVACLPVVQAATIPYIYATDYEGAGCSPVMYVTGETPDMKDPAYIKFLMDKGSSKFFLLANDYNWARISFKLVRQLIETSGGSVVGEEYAPFSTADYTTLISKIKSAGADTIISGLAGGPDNTAFYKQANAAGLKVTIGALALDGSTLAAVGGAAAGTYMATSYFDSIDNQKNKDFLAALQAMFGTATQPQGYLSQASYDSVHLYALAANKAGSTKPHEVLTALAQVSFDGPRGVVAPNADRHSPLPIYIAQADAHGKYIIVKSLGVQTPAQQCNPEPPIPANP
jgi:branched-chain amino acid transport system substrate-binding protein